jgi:hypothetical protein
MGGRKFVIGRTGTGICLRAESDVKPTVCIALPPEMAWFGSLSRLRSAARARRAALAIKGRMGMFEGTPIEAAEASDGDEPTMWIRETAFRKD